MRDQYLQFVWTWTVRIFVALGGIAGMTRILEWFFKGPKIIGEVEQFIVIGATDADRVSNPRTAIFMLLYLVNKRIQPTTIRKFTAKFKIAGKWIAASHIAIPDGFTLPTSKVEFSKAKLFDIAGINLLEYGKGIRGWLYFSLANIPVEDTRDAPVLITATDAFGKDHIFKHILKPGPKDAPDPYFPGAGIPSGK